MNGYVQDMDVSSMYAWSPLILKQSLICKVLKQSRTGKSHKAKISAKRRLRLYKSAWVEYDVLTDRDWTRKHISTIEYKVEVDDETEDKVCLNQTYGFLT
jgi:hypothetical protein